MWSAAHDATLAQWTRAGVSVAQAARALDRSPEWIASRLATNHRDGAFAGAARVTALADNIRAASAALQARVAARRRSRRAEDEADAAAAQRIAGQVRRLASAIDRVERVLDM